LLGEFDGSCHEFLVVFGHGLPFRLVFRTRRTSAIFIGLVQQHEDQHFRGIERQQCADTHDLY
jgi:hypothetical protein